MADTRLYVQAQPFTLYGSGSSIGDTSFTLTTFLDATGVALSMASFGLKGYGTLEPGTSQEEPITWTGVTVNGDGTATLTGVSRQLAQAPYTETSGLAKSHSGGARFVVSNTAGFHDGFANKNDDETVTGAWNVPTPTSSDTAQIANVDYVNSVALAGAPNASQTVKGIVQNATAAQITAGTATGSTGAALDVTPDQLALSKYGTQLPTANEKAALVGTSGTAVSASNKLVDNGDTTTTASAGKVIRGKSVTGKLDESVCQMTDAQVTDLTDGLNSTAHQHNPNFQRTLLTMTAPGSTNNGVQFACHPTNGDFYVYRWGNTNQGGGVYNWGCYVYRHSMDAKTGCYKLVSTTTFSWTNSSGTITNGNAYAYGIIISPTYVWLPYVVNGTSSTYRFARFNLDMTGETAVTPNSNPTNVAVMMGGFSNSDGTIYVSDGSTYTDVTPYTVSGTNATKGTAFTVATQGQYRFGMCFDGTYVFMLDGSVAAPSVKKYTLAGSLSSTTSLPVISDNDRLGLVLLPNSCLYLTGGYSLSTKDYASFIALSRP